MKGERGKEKGGQQRHGGNLLSHSGSSQEQNLTVQINLECLHCRERAGKRREMGQSDKEKEEIKRQSFERRVQCAKEEGGNERRGRE